MAKPLIGIIGSASPSDQGYHSAREVGRMLAERGFDIVCGGLGGVMEAASRGCDEGGGVVIGLLPGGEASTGNRFLSYAIPTNVGHARNVLIAHASVALIAVEGEYGTLSEIAIALKLGKPVVALSTPWDVPGVTRADCAADAVLKLITHLEDVS